MISKVVVSMAISFCASAIRALERVKEAGQLVHARIRDLPGLASRN